MNYIETNNLKQELRMRATALRREAECLEALKDSLSDRLPYEACLAISAMLLASSQLPISLVDGKYE